MDYCIIVKVFLLVFTFAHSPCEALFFDYCIVDLHDFTHRKNMIFRDSPYLVRYRFLHWFFIIFGIVFLWFFDQKWLLNLWEEWGFFYVFSVHFLGIGFWCLFDGFGIDFGSILGAFWCRVPWLVFLFGYLFIYLVLILTHFWSIFASKLVYLGSFFVICVRNDCEDSLDRFAMFRL